MTPRVMSTGSQDASSERSYPRSALGFTVLGLAILVVLAVVLIRPAAAQRYDGRNSTPSVTVDLSVLDDLGRAPNVPQLILRNPTGSAYVDNPYRSMPKFPVISNSTGRLSNQRVVLRPPPTTTKRRITRRHAKKTARRTTRPARKKVARRTPLRKRTAVASTPRKPVATPLPPPTTDLPPAAVVPPPPRIAVAKPRKMEMPAAVSAGSEAPKAPEPPPLPPVTTAQKPRDVARRYALPPPAPPKANTRPERETRRNVASRPTPAKKPTRTAPSRPTQVASLPRATPPVRSGSLRRIEFPHGSAKLSDKASLGLRNVASAMSRDPSLRIQLLAYAGQLGDSASQARRLSLSRALAARSKLIEQGVRSTRIDVRALGNKSAGGPADRIDIIVTKR